MRASQHPGERLMRRGARVEAAYLIAVVSVVALVLGIIVLTGVTRRQLAAHAAVIDGQSSLIEELEQRIASLEQQIRATAPRAAASPTARAPAEASATRPTPLSSGRTTSRRAAESRPTPSDPLAVIRDDYGRIALVDPQAARARLADLARGADRAPDDVGELSRLALAAQLAGDEAQAESAAMLAESAGGVASDYCVHSGGALLAAGDAAGALVAAERVLRVRDDGAARVLGAAACLELGRQTDAGQLLDGVNGETLSAADRLRACQVLAALERWGAMAALLEMSTEVPAGLRAQRNELRAMALVRSGRLPEALAVLESLLEGRGDAFELRVWQAYALLDAGETEAARAALDAATPTPERPEGWHVLGLIEMARGNVDEAAGYFQRAIAASSRFSRSWEALGMIALNRADLETAISNLMQASETGPYRGAPRLLLAIAQARAGNRSEAESALRGALARAPELIEAARQAPVIAEMFDDAELRAMAGAVREPG